MSALPNRHSAALADRYRLERELGRGGMATVYLVQDLKHDRKVALKVLKPELAAVLGPSGLSWRSRPRPRPSDPAGLREAAGLRMADDPRVYAYRQTRYMSSLFVAEGAR